MCRWWSMRRETGLISETVWGRRPPHSYREACVQNLHLSPVKMNSKGVRSSFLHVSHIPPSSHAPFCPITLQALSKLCPSRVFEVPSCMFPIFRHPVMPHSAQALSKLCPSPPFLSKLAIRQCREFKFLLLSGVCESHNSGIQSLVATFGGLRVPQIRPLVTSHLVQSLSDRCPNCDRAPPHF